MRSGLGRPRFTPSAAARDVAQTLALGILPETLALPILTTGEASVDIVYTHLGNLDQTDVHNTGFQVGVREGSLEIMVAGLITLTCRLDSRVSQR
jgi:hypothetical protein